VDGVLGKAGEVRVYKGDLSSFFLTSNQSWLNSWGFRQCVYTSFSLTRLLGFWLGVHYRLGGGREFFYFVGFSTVVGFKDVG
jgi:hypothetical protein